MLGGLDHVWSPIVPCYSAEDAGQIINSFYLQLQSLTPLLHVRNYNHSQLFLNLCHIYTAYNLTGQYSILDVFTYTSESNCKLNASAAFA
jgi:hypothetical protein